MGNPQSLKTKINFKKGGEPLTILKCLSRKNNTSLEEGNPQPPNALEISRRGVVRTHSRKDQALVLVLPLVVS